MDPDEFHKQENYECFAERYARDRSAASRQLERRVLGHETGVNGYTTVEEADVLADRLALHSNQRVLDVGAGLGWPGSRVSATTSTDLVSMDLPVAGLRIALADSRLASGTRNHAAVAADGRALPFAAESFDAIVHADVFC